MLTSATKLVPSVTKCGPPLVVPRLWPRQELRFRIWTSVLRGLREDAA